MILCNGSNSFLSKIPEDMVKSIEQMPTESEVKEVVFSISKYRTIGPNGFSTMFYQKCWAIIQKDLMEAVANFFLGFPTKRIYINHDCVNS